MENRHSAGLTLLAVLVLGMVATAQGPPRTLVGWGIDRRNPEQFIASAEAVGFDVLISWSTDPTFLQKAVEAGKQHSIRIFSCISPMGGLARLWKKEYPDKPVPWQVMTTDEQHARTFIMAGKNKYIIPYQFGGEPALTNEVLTTNIVCLRNPKARDLLKRQIDAIAAVPGLDGLALDGFGYQNYRRCHCQDCNNAFEEYCREHAEQTRDEADTAFFRDALVDCINDLANHARSKRNDIRTTLHIWPVFVPEPLYGNRLDVDFCGQTAAWYTIWPQKKIAEYSKIIAAQARRYHPRQQGVGMIGYYDKPGQFPVKDAACVDMELGTMVENGCHRIQVCGTRDVISNEAVAAVFRKYFSAASSPAPPKGNVNGPPSETKGTK